MGGGLLCANMGRCQNLLRLYPNSPPFPPISNNLPLIPIKIMANLSNILQWIRHISIQMLLKRKFLIFHELWLVWMKRATLRCFAYFLFLFYASTFENLGDQGSAYLHVVYVQIGLRMSFHELFKHTFYPSLSLCFAYFPFLFYASTFENLGDQNNVFSWFVFVF